MQTKNYERLRDSAQILRAETNFSNRKISKILDVSERFVIYNTKKETPKRINIIEDWVCNFDDIDFIRLRHKTTIKFVKKQINRYKGLNQQNKYGLKSKV